MTPWLFVTLADGKLALRFPYHAPTVQTLKREFGGEGGVARWNPDDRCWTLPRGQFAALCAVFGDRLSVHGDVWSAVYPARVPRPKPARQRDIWGGSVAVRKEVRA